MNIFLQRFSNNKHIFFIITIILLFVLYLLFFDVRDTDVSHLETFELNINGKIIHTYIADDDFSREKGLSVFDNFDENKAMLFVFKRSGNYNFWMKDMKFPIDIVWLNSDKRIVYIKRDARPEDYPDSYGPDMKSLYVLEFKSGFVDDNNIKILDTLDFVY